MTNCRFLECEILNRTKCIACRKGLKYESYSRRIDMKLHTNQPRVAAHCCASCSQIESSWTQADTVEVIAFTRKLGLCDLTVIGLLYSIITIEINHSLLWLKSLQQGNSNVQCAPHKTHLSLQKVRRLLNLWLKDASTIRDLLHRGQTEESMRKLYCELCRHDVGPLIGLFIGLRANRFNNQGVFDLEQNSRDVLDIVHLLQMHLIKDGWSRDCLILDKAIQKDGENFYCTTLASLLELRFDDNLLPTTNTLGVAQLEYYFFPNRRVIKRVLLRSNLPNLLTKLVLCHELVHLNLWFRLPARPCGRHPIEEILCHAIMIHYANWIIRSRGKARLTLAEYSLLARRINRCYKKCDQVNAGLLRRWVDTLGKRAPIDPIRTKSKCIKNNPTWSTLATEYFHLIYKA